MRVIIDINVIMDWLFKRKGHEFAVKVVDLCANKKIDGFVCAHEVTYPLLVLSGFGRRGYICGNFCLI